MQVQRGTDQQTIGLSGVVTCGSPWSCPCCACRIYTSRGAELTQAVEGWAGPLPDRRDGAVSLLTLTLRHGLGDDLREIRRALCDAWRRMWQGEPGRRLRRALGVEHHVRALEVTFGGNGWHPHLHALLFHVRPPSDDALELVRARWVRVFERLASSYRRQARELRGTREDDARALELERKAKAVEWATPDHEHGADLRPSHRSDYIAKLGLEVASIGTKTPKTRGSRTPWDIATDAAEGDVDARALWIEYTEAMHGARQLTWSKGARVALGLNERDEDEDHAEEPPGTLLADIPAAVWDFWSRVPGWTSELLRRAKGPTPILDVEQWLRWHQRAGP